MADDSTDRTASHIHIDHTIIHIPESLKQTVTLDGTGDYNGRAYDFLRPRHADGSHADSAEVYIVPACTTTDTAPSLCLGASAGLLTPEDWAADPADIRTDPPVEVQYEFEAITWTAPPGE